MLTTSTPLRPAPLLRARGIGLRRCIGPNAFGNALGHSLADQIGQGSQQYSKLEQEQDFARENARFQRQAPGAGYTDQEMQQDFARENARFERQAAAAREENAMGLGSGLNPYRSSAPGLRISESAYAGWSNRTNEGILQGARQLQAMEDLSRELNPPLPEYELLAGPGPLVPKKALPPIEGQGRYVGGVMQAAGMGWNEAMNPNNSLGQRLVYGGLSLAATPVAAVESLLYAPLNVAPAARELGQVAARASLQTDPTERNLDILRGVSLGAEGFTSAGAWVSGPRPQVGFTQSAAELAAIRATYNDALTGVPINGATRTVPLGFQAESQFLTAANELQGALQASGVNDALVGVRGSSVTGYSITKGTKFGPQSDIDFFVESAQLTSGYKTSNNIPGFVHPNKILPDYPLLQDWTTKWNGILGRDITPGAFVPGKLPTQPAIVVKSK